MIGVNEAVYSSYPHSFPAHYELETFFLIKIIDQMIGYIDLLLN